MTVFEKEGRTCSLKQNPGRKLKLSDRDSRTLTQIVRKDYKKTAPKITPELNGYFENSVYSKNVEGSYTKPYYHEFVRNFQVFRLFCPLLYIYIYIYIYRERERERESSTDRLFRCITTLQCS